MLPKVSPDVGRVVIPAGSLDIVRGAQEGPHIFVASKAPWFEITGNLLRYDEYPPG